MQRDLKKMVLASVAVGMLYSGTAVCQAEAVAQDDDIVDVVVTAERMPSSRMSTPADVTVITAEQIEDNHYSDVAEALIHVNGVVVNNGNANGEQQVIINGDQRVVILIDGQRLNNDQGVASGRASASLAMIPSVKNIERIEVVKGAGSALYGSDAVGGVVNIITKKGGQNETTIDLNTGSYGTHNYEFTNQGSEGDWSWFVTGGIQRRGNFEYRGAGGEGTVMKNSDYSNKSLSLRLDKKFTDSDSLRFMFTHRQQDIGIFNNDDGLRQENNYNYGSITYNFKENQPIHGFFRYGVNYKSSDNQGKFDTHSHDIEYQNGWQLGNHKIVAGGEWYQSTSNNNQSGYINKNITTQALFLQDTIKIRDKWTFIPGIRMDHHSMFGTHWSPKAALNFQPDNSTKIYASWGRVFKAPTADDLYYDKYGSKGDPNMKPESGHVETIGFTHEFSEKAIMDMSYFWSELHNHIAWYPNTFGIWNPTNLPYEKKHGLNISLNGALSDRWSYEMGYSYISRDTDGVQDAYYYEPNGYRLGIHYNCDRWKANLLGRFGSGLDDSAQGYDSRGYAIWDFNTSYAATENVDIYFKVNNLTNQRYLTVPRGKYNTFYPNQGRTFLVGANIKF